MSQLIMQAKVYAVRDAQMAEKRIIDREMQEEERRLDLMMEQVRREGGRSRLDPYSAGRS